MKDQKRPQGQALFIFEMKFRLPAGKRACLAENAFLFPLLSSRPLARESLGRQAFNLDYRHPKLSRPLRAGCQ
jgi:hypothetical protein